MTYKEFWPFYLDQHKHPLNRWLHALGTVIGTTILVYSLVTDQYSFIFLALFLGYFFSWTGHFIVEKNRPATFTYPLKSFVSDYRMCALLLTGNLKSKNQN